MPYQTVDDLPPEVKGRYSGEALRAFLAAFNSAMERYDDESRAFAIAHAAAGRLIAKAVTDHLNTVEKDAPSTGPTDAQIAFIGASPSRLDAARKEPLVGPTGAIFKKRYLEPLGLKRSEVYLANVVPNLLLDASGPEREPTREEVAKGMDVLTEELDRVRPSVVVALGWLAKAALGDRADFVLPHPAAIKRWGSWGEVRRKLRSVKKAMAGPEGGEYRLAKVDGGALQLDLIGGSLAGRYLVQDAQMTEREKLIKKPSDYTDRKPPAGEADDSGLGSDREYLVEILKADEEKQIVTSVVMEPDVYDTQGDITSSDVIEKAAHRYLVESRTTGDSHKQEIPADIVESYIAPIDLKIEDWSEPVTKGSWIVSEHIVKRSDWENIKEGRRNSYSIQGTGKREEVKT